MIQQPTVLDVAQAAGVSRQTVSNVLNAPGVVRPSTRERVEMAIERLGYLPHVSARRLRTKQSSTIGIRLDPPNDGISGTVLDRYLHALTERAAKRGLGILLYTATNPGAEILQFHRLLKGADVDAFVLTSTYDGDPRTRWLREHGANFVTFGRPWGEDDLDDPAHRWVDVDGADGTEQATEQLISLGARYIAFLGWPEPSGTGADRRKGWARRMRLAGLSESEISALQWASTENAAEAQAVVAAHLTKDIDGLVCASDSLALGALMATTSVGKAGLPIVGFDNSPVSAALGLSSIDQSLDAVAESTIRLLRDEEPNPTSRTESHPWHQLIKPRLIPRTR